MDGQLLEMFCFEEKVILTLCLKSELSLEDGRLGNQITVSEMEMDDASHYKEHKGRHGAGMLDCTCQHPA